MKSYNEKDGGLLTFLKNNKVIVSLLILCLIGGLAIYSFQSALSRNADKSGSEGTEDMESPDISVSRNIPVTDSRDNDGSSGSAISEESDEDGENPGGGSISIMPAEGEIIRDYSGDRLVYSDTLNQYLAHKAVDIGAPVGSAVAAVESGTVILAGEDDRYGMTVVISHGEGLETSYGCLGECTVSIGDVVTKGDKVGTVGEEALFEAADGPHLHFEVKKDGSAVNPHEIWNW